MKLLRVTIRRLVPCYVTECGLAITQPEINFVPPSNYYELLECSMKFSRMFLMQAKCSKEF